MAITAIMGGLGAVAGIAGPAISAFNQPDGPTVHDQPALGLRPEADPLLSAFSQQGLLGLGQIDPTLGFQSNPLQQLIANANRSGTLTKRDQRLLEQASAAPPEVLLELANMSGDKKSKLAFLASKGMSKKEANKVIKGLPQIERQLAASGFTSLQELFDTQASQRSAAEARNAQFAPVAERIQQGLLGLQGDIGDNLGQLPNLLTGEANPFTERLREDALISAQRTGANPYQMLEQADAIALQKALGLITGQQLALSNQLNPGQAASAQRIGAGGTAAQIGGQQAQLLGNPAFLGLQQQAQQNQAMGPAVAGYAVQDAFGGIVDAKKGKV